MAKAQAAVDSANQRAARSERLLEQARADLQTERDDARLSQLHEQLAQLIARKPTRRPAARTRPPRSNQRPLRRASARGKPLTGRVLTRAVLIDRIWGADYVGDIKTSTSTSSGCGPRWRSIR